MNQEVNFLAIQNGDKMGKIAVIKLNYKKNFPAYMKNEIIENIEKHSQKQANNPNYKYKNIVIDKIFVNISAFIIFLVKPVGVSTAQNFLKHIHKYYNPEKNTTLTNETEEPQNALMENFSVYSENDRNCCIDAMNIPEFNGKTTRFDKEDFRDGLFPYSIEICKNKKTLKVCYEITIYEYIEPEIVVDIANILQCNSFYYIGKKTIRFKTESIDVLANIEEFRKIVDEYLKEYFLNKLIKDISDDISKKISINDFIDMDDIPF